jgi:hypothetical protein
MTNVLAKFAGFQGGLKIAVHRMMGDGELIAAEVSSSGIHKAEGFEYKQKYHFLITVRGGLIVAVKEYMDTKHVADLFSAILRAQRQANEMV